MFLFFFSYWKGRLPRQGYMYLSVNHLCFYAFNLGDETKIIIRWSEIMDLERSRNLLFPDSIKIVTRDKSEVESCLQNEPPNAYFSAI